MNQFQLDFLGIGTIKSGTSLLADLMMQHPQIQWSSRKELNYFNAFQADGSPNPYHDQPLTFYRRFFPDTLPDGMKRGEYSPVYINDQAGMKKIQSIYPDIRLIVTLRHPVERAFSHYLYVRDFLQSIPENCTFEQALESYPYLKSLSKYSRQLQRLFSMFTPSQCLVLIFEEMIQNPVESVQKVYNHIGVENSFSPQVRKVNPNKKIRYQWLENVVNTISHLKSNSQNSLVDSLYKSPIYPILLKWKHRIRDTNVTTVEKPILANEIYERLFTDFQTDIIQTKKLLNRQELPWS